MDDFNQDTSHEVLTLGLDSMAHGGAAVGRDEGKVIFVAGGLPGETVQAAVVEDHTRYAQARLASVETASGDRIPDPRCPHFGDPLERFSVAGLERAQRFCGGCQWQHADYGAQLRYKQAILADQLQRIGRLEAPVVRPTLGMDEPWHYRNRVDFTVGPEGELSFIGIDGKSLVEIDVCYIIHPLLADLLGELELDFPALERVRLRAGVDTGDQMVILETADDEPPAIEIDIAASCILQLADGPAVSLAGSTYIEETVCGRRFQISAGAFFQVNTLMTAELVRTILQYLEPRGYETLLDLYCGVGTFGICLADTVGAIIGVEENPVAVDDAVVNAEGLENALFYEGFVADVLPVLDERVDLVVLDPPRAGVGREVVAALADLRPARIAYVSCDPATLARDVRRMHEAGYKLVEVQPVDLFPQTYHVESVALFVRDE